MKRQGARYTVDILFVLVLFCVLAICALSVVLIGANVYRGTVQRMDDSFSSTTSLNYMANKIRQNDIEGAVYLSEVEGTPAVVLERTFNETEFTTWIFHDAGYLREVMVRKGETVHLSDGLAILQISRFSMEQESEDLLRFATWDQSGSEVSILIAVRSGAAAPEFVNIPA